MPLLGRLHRRTLIFSTTISSNAAITRLVEVWWPIVSVPLLGSSVKGLRQAGVNELCSQVRYFTLKVLWR